MEASFGRSGAVAGVIAALAFTLIHDIVISDIWAMLPIMAVAGAISGACLGWSYARMVSAPSLRTWLAYTTTYLLLFGLLGAISVVVFEPVTTMAAVIERGGPVDDLIVQALPMTIAFTVAAAVLVTWLFGRGWRDLGAVGLTTAVLVLFLGLNISAIGLVEIPRSGLYLIGELFGLVAVIGLVFTLVMVPLQRRSLR
jgi:hypothetical protein